MKVLSIFGTRPEAIKMCPLIKKMELHPEIESIVCLTGQHREMLQQVIDTFKIHIDYNLDIMKNNQTLTTITADVLNGLEPILKEVNPNIVLVHGDTTTSFAAALAAFYLKIPVGHVEAGLRTKDKYSPFPEEMNRTLTGQIAQLHFVPTALNAQNLQAEGVNHNIFITGNTVIDAFKTTVKKEYCYKNKHIQSILDLHDKIALVTAHRRENLGLPLENICAAIYDLAEHYSNLQFIYPVHMNPSVRKIVYMRLSNHPRIHLIDPIDVEDMHNLMSVSHIVLTDSGGLQEEAPAFGIPVLVLRTETERPEAVDAGTVKVVGNGRHKIYTECRFILDNQEEYQKMAMAINPYGDGFASERIIEYLLTWYKEKLPNN